MSTLRNLNVNLELGQTILVGVRIASQHRSRKIEFHEKSGEIDINTTKGPRKVLSFALCADDTFDSSVNPADKYQINNFMRINELLEERRRYLRTGLQQPAYVRAQSQTVL